MASISLISSKKVNPRKQDRHAESNQETLQSRKHQELNGTNQKIVGMGLNCPLLWERRESEESAENGFMKKTNLGGT